jgi:thiopeptide-type bacteriocin biosynthesis protein
MNPREALTDFAPSGFFAMRTPLLPFDELLAWGDGLQAASVGTDPAQLQAAVADDRALLRQRLREVYARPEVREALFLASPDLEARLPVWLQEPEDEVGEVKIELALVRYFERMAGRATPFGLCAGCSVGMLGVETRLALVERGRYGRHTRLGLDYLVSLSDALARDPAVQPRLVFDVNSSLYPAQGRYRYREVRRNGKGSTHHTIALEATDYLAAVLARARGGAPFETLVAALLDYDPDATADEAREYVGDLVNNQILVPEMRPTVTGPEPITGIIDRLRRPPAALANGDGHVAEESGPAGAAHRLGQVQHEFAALDAGGLGGDPARYRSVAELLQDLPGAIDRTRLFHVDMVKPVESATLGPAVLDEVRLGVMLLHRLARRPKTSDLTRDENREAANPLAAFRQAFERRYEGREVPLVEALDEDAGVGFGTAGVRVFEGSSLLDGLTFPNNDEKTARWGPRETILLRKVHEAVAAGAVEVCFTPTDLDELAKSVGTGEPPPLPDAFAVMVSVAAASAEAIDQGEFQVLLRGVSGPSGGRLLGRFCHADPELRRLVEEHLQAEEAFDPDAVFAEIVHLPEGHVGNVLSRPCLRAYEIPYLGAARVPPERQIPVTDLRVSVVGQRVVLRSERLGRRVIPRLTNAHNFEPSTGIYRFLCELQFQGTAGDLGWDWGPLREAPFLPRVVAGRLVLARATWRVSGKELKRLGKLSGTDRFRAVQEWRAERRLPRWIAIADSDNELAIDLDNVLSIITLIEVTKGRDEAQLVELFPGPDQLWVRGPEGRFVHEMVIPFERKSPQRPTGHSESVRKSPVPFSDRLSVTRSPGQPGTLSRRSFPPGSEWLYAKLYTGPAMADQVLSDLVGPVVETARRDGATDRWFFIRYVVSAWHLRLRFHGHPDRLRDEVLPLLQAAAAPLLEDGRLWRLQFDTYEREVERYGGPEGIELAEQLFHADSEAVLALATQFPNDARGDARWRLALLGMDMLLDDLGFDLETRRAVVRAGRDGRAAQFRADAKLRHELSAKFRKERRDLEALLPHRWGEVKEGGDAPSEGIQEVLQRRSQRLAPVMTGLKAAAAAGWLSVPLTELAPSYLHMHVNRVLRSAHGPQELVLYDFLTRLYDAQAAQAKDSHRLVAAGEHVEKK